MVVLTFFLLLAVLNVSVMGLSHMRTRTVARTLSSRRMAMSGDAEAYSAIRDQIKSGVAAAASEGKVPEGILQTLDGFLDDYVESNLAAKSSPEFFQQTVGTFIAGVQKALQDPYPFEPYHVAIREPFDFYKWGNDFMRPLVINEQSRAVGLDKLKALEDKLASGENVLLLSNHQTEADPQVMSILLEENDMGHLAEKIIFVAGHKVTSDPIAIPFSMGRNLLCIHSKKHIRNPPEDFERKQAQNLESMKSLGELASKGGNIFWVAPSGGRDRPDPETGNFVVAPFDLKALDMFKLISMQSQKKMHFVPMAMYTHQLIPPPKSVSSSLGEERSAKRGAVSVKVLDATDGIGGLKDKEYKAEVEASVKAAYDELSAWHDSRKSELASQ
mmetsp:Transcript_30885/g.52255  ORF Transcript_30885/g.52255 Transcript_30885/m.52255 type:complete len:387 (+) Transcript_30885:95-1255(+)